MERDPGKLSVPATIGIFRSHRRFTICSQRLNDAWNLPSIPSGTGSPPLTAPRCTCGGRRASTGAITCDG